MFDHLDFVIGLWPGEGTEVDAQSRAEDHVSYELTCRALADGWVASGKHDLPSDLEQIAVGPFLAAIVTTVDSTKLSGHDAVRLMKARSRLSSHHEAGKYAAMAEVAYSPPTDPDSGVFRTSEEVEYAAVEIAAALCLTRRPPRTN